MSLFRMLRFRMPAVPGSRTLYTTGERLCVLNERNFKFSHFLATKITPTTNLTVYSPEESLNTPGTGHLFNQITEIMGEVHKDKIKIMKPLVEACGDIAELEELSKVILVNPGQNDEVKLLVESTQALPYLPEIHLVSFKKTLLKPIDLPLIAQETGVELIDDHQKAGIKYGREFWVWRLRLPAQEQ